MIRNRPVLSRPKRLTPASRWQAYHSTRNWLTQDEIRHMIRALRQIDTTDSPIVARNTAIIILMVTCGLRRDEVSGAHWGDLGRQGRNSILRVHGKGEKMRMVKLPEMA